jgi:hypothetical protein
VRVLDATGLTLRALLWIVRVEGRRCRRPFGELVDRLEREPVGERPSVATERALAAVRRAYLMTPFRRTCLRESLAGVGLLRSLGYGARLGIGVKGAGTPVEAHAWIEVDGKPLDPGAAAYAPLRRARS